MDFGPFGATPPGPAPRGYILQPSSIGLLPVKVSRFQLKSSRSNGVSPYPRFCFLNGGDNYRYYLGHDKLKVPSSMSEMRGYISFLHMCKVSGLCLRSYVLQYPVILLVDSKGPRQTAQMRRLIWALLIAVARRHVFVRRGPLDRSRMRLLLCSYGNLHICIMTRFSVKKQQLESSDFITDLSKLNVKKIAFGNKEHTTDYKMRVSV